MKLSTAKYFSLLLIATAMVSSLSASRLYMEEETERCLARCYECGCNPLYKEAWDLQVHAGVNPIIWRQRNNWVAVDQGVAVNYFESPKFSKVYRAPWYVGGQVGYAATQNGRLFIEFDYTQANRKENVVIPTLNPVFDVDNARKYKLFEAYLGGRYYFDRWADCVSFFVGAKVGLTHHKKVDFDFHFTGAGNIQVFENQFVYDSNTVVSGGAHGGFDFCVCGNWSIVVTGEVVASGGPRPAGLIATQAAGLSVTQILPAPIGSELRFPVTGALRYNF